jgi:hypothetical protein
LAPLGLHVGLVAGIFHNPTIIYKVIPNWQVLASGEFKYTDVPGGAKGGFQNNFFRALFTVTRKNILVEKEHGVQLDAGVGRRDFNNVVNPTTFGNNRAFTTLTKNFGKNNASLFIQYLYNDPKLSDNTTWKHTVELIPSFTIQLTEKLSYFFSDDINISMPKFSNTAKSHSISHEMNLAVFNYQWTEKLSTYYQFKYLREEDYTNDPTANYFTHAAGLAYAFTPKITLTGEVASEIFRKDDGRKFFAKAASYPEVTVYLDLAL